MPRRSLKVMAVWMFAALTFGSVFASGHPSRGADELFDIEQQTLAAPILLRNEINPIERVIFHSPPAGLRLKAITIDLSRTDALKDIGAVEVLVGPDPAKASRFGMTGTPAGSVRIEGETAVAEGTTLWVSLRLNPKASLSRYVSARCAGIELSNGKSGFNEPIARAPRRHIGIALRRAKDDGVHTHRIPVLATSKRGTLLCAYDLRRRAGRDLQEDIDIGLSRSVDGGKTWERPRVIMDQGTYGNLPQEQNGCSDPGLIVDRRTGEIFCFAVWMWGKPGKHQWNDDGSEPGYEIGKSAQLLMVRSRDDGKTWSNPENLTRLLKKPEWWLLAPAPQQGIQLPDGTLVMPMQGRDAKGVPFATIMRSSDHGKSWTLGEPAFSEGNECQAALLGDGSIMLNMRNDHRNGYRAVAVTRDLGRTWAFHPTHENTLIEPNCNASLYRVDYREEGRKRHVLLFSNPQSKSARTHQTLQVSFDDGMTWPSKYHRLLDEGRGAGYSSLTRIDDRHIGIIYEGSRAQLVFERFSLDDLLHPER